MIRSRAGLLLLVLALLLAQTLGLMHRVSHPAPMPGTTGSAYWVAKQARAMQGEGARAHAAAADPARTDAGVAASPWLAKLFGHDESGCCLFDQAAQGALTPEVPAAALPLVPGAFVLSWFQGEVLARWAALFDARGPPSIR